MNINSKAFSAKRLTKRQRKAQHGDNYMVKQSKLVGNQIGDYIGRLPQFRDISGIGEISRFVKTRAGVPFVRTLPKGV